MYTISLCEGGSYKVLPETPRKIDLASAEKKLKASGWEILAATPVLLIMQSSEAGKVTLYPLGKLIFSTLTDEEKVKKVSREIYSII